ncbi:MAG: DUF354 domain-containing protein [Candidatus Helarchaeota archaeon]
MALLWFDIMTPKEVWLFGSIQEYLRKLGYNILITTREHDKNIGLLELRGLEFTSIGKHGGGTLEGKLKASLERTVGLAGFITSKVEKPGVCISLCSVEAARVAFGLNIPHICFDDAPHAIAVGKLVIPLSKFVISPNCIPQDKFYPFGIDEKNIIQYDGIDEVAWISDFKANKKILSELNLNEDELLIILRPKESQAAYLLNDLQKENPLTFTFELINQIIKYFKNAQIVVLSRYPSQFKSLQTKFKDHIILPSKAVDGPNLISFADIVISGGATMEREAALLGIPAISYFPIALDIEIYLKNKGFPIWHLKNYQYVIELVLKILKNPKKYKLDTRELLKKLENPKKILYKLLLQMGITP